MHQNQSRAPGPHPGDLLNDRTERTRSSDPKDHTVAHIDPLRQRIWDHVSHSPSHQPVGLPGRPPRRRRQAHLQLLQRGQPPLPRGRARLLLPLRSLSHPGQRLRHPRPRRPNASRPLRQAPRLPRPRRPALRLRHRPRDLQPDHRQLHRRQDHLRPRRRPLVRLRRLLRHPGHPQHRLQGQGNPALLEGPRLRHPRHRPARRARHPHLACLLAGDFLALLRQHIVHSRAPRLSPASPSASISPGPSPPASSSCSSPSSITSRRTSKTSAGTGSRPAPPSASSAGSLASLILRIYLHYFNNYSVTYGSLGAVIILLTWFYITGLMLLLGAEINSEIAAAAAEKTLKDAGAIPAHATTDHEHPIDCAALPEACPPGQANQPTKLSA